MFGSPASSTPFSKFRTVGTSSSSMSFGQQSANKRKRDQISTLQHTEPTNTHTKVRGLLELSNIVAESLEGSTSRVFNNGQLLIVPSQGFDAFYHHDIFLPSGEFVVISKKNEDDYSGIVDGGVGPSDSTDLVGCTEHGRLTIVNLASDGTQVHLHQKLQLREEGERITLACHAGNVAVLGSSTEELYLVRRYGRTLNADRLQRNRGLFANLFTSGARLMGIASSTPSDGRVVKLLPVPMSFFLLALGSSSLVLWSDWTNPGSEQLVWDINLKDILTHDMSSLDLFGDTGAFSMVDACLMPAEPGAENGTLLVLSTFENRAGSLNGSLWIHTLSVQFSSEAIGATVTILHRLVLSEHACWVQQGSIAPATVGPRIHHLSPSWKVFVSWSAESQAQPQPQSQQRCDREEAGGARTVHGAQIDVLNQALLNASVSREGDQRSRKQALLDAVRCSSGVNSLIDAKTVLDAAAVKGQDGIVIVTNDGTISLFTPPLPKRALADFPLTTTTLRDRLSATSSSSAVTVATPAVAQTTITDAASLLHSAALGEVASEDVGKTVRDVFDALAVSADIAAAVQAASTKLMNRSPTGEYWGLGSGSAERSSSATVAGARALTQYQMVHRLVETKLNAHKKLIEIVNSSDVSHPGVQVSLCKDHQALLLCAGLSGAVEEAQMRYTSASNRAMEGGVDSVGALVAGSFQAQSQSQRVALEALAIVAEGIERAVRVGRGLSLEDIDSQGLSVVDMFYAEAGLVYIGISSIVQALKDSQGSLAQKGMLQDTAFAVSSIVLSALQLAMVGEGASVPSVSANCNQKVRDVLASLIVLLRDAAAEGRQSQGFTAESRGARAGQMSGGVAVDKEGKRLKELCSVALQSYALEASTSENSTVEGMPKDWRDKYHYVKGICSSLLLETGNHQAGFALCAEHLYCMGLMESTQRDPHTLQPRLEETLRRAGAQVGTDTVPLATGCFLWLEAHNRPADILSLGTTNPALLEEFLKTRSHLAWMHHLRSGHFSQATVSAVEHASTVPVLGKAATLLSIAKLCAKLAGDTTTAQEEAPPSALAQGNPKRLFMPSAVSPAKAKTGLSVPLQISQADLDSAVQNLNADLAVIRAQEIVLDTLPNFQYDMHVRMNVSDLVKLISRALRHHGASATVAVPDELHPLRASDVSVLPRLFGIGLGLLSMQMDLLDSLIVAAAKEREGENDTAAAGLSLQSGRIALSQLEQQYAQHSQQGRLQQLRRQEESFAALLVDLWGSLIAANTLTWLELSCYPTLGAQEEVAVKTDCWLYGAIVGAVGEAASGNLRGELIPTVQQQAEVVPAGEQSLLQQALSSSQVISKRLGSDGDIEDVRGGQENQRVVHIIKVCVNMALGAGSVGNMQ